MVLIKLVKIKQIISQTECLAVFLAYLTKDTKQMSSLFQARISAATGVSLK
jgi:hypothetical protein